MTPSDFTLPRALPDWQSRELCRLMREKHNASVADEVAELLIRFHNFIGVLHACPGSTGGTIGRAVFTTMKKIHAEMLKRDAPWMVP